ncbi:hypothetical protein H0H87_012136 [Tephrocybe sp. NHM501043]|nr:hypothetical protein H0H87_012136 [Tephrocybe sp. NHM501043]
MDVTLPTVARHGTADTPDKNDDRRVCTSPSTILKMSYGIADALGKNDTLNMLDIVQEIKTKTQNLGAVICHYIRDRFVGGFVYELDNMEKYGDDVPDALRRSFLGINRLLIMALHRPPKESRKNSIVTIEKDFRFSPPIE